MKLHPAPEGAHEQGAQMGSEAGLGRGCGSSLEAELGSGTSSCSHPLRERNHRFTPCF